MHTNHSRASALLLSLFMAHGSLLAMDIIAHRGASADSPENTLAAMQLAWEHGADAIELDLWLSKDGKLVVFHDGDTKRFERNSRKIPELTWAELQQLDVGAWKNAKFTGERIPALESILATIPPRRRAVLEIKCGPEILPELDRVLRASRRTSKELVIICFNFETLKQSKLLFPDIEHYFLHDYKKDRATDRYPEIDPLIARCKAANFQGLDLHYDWPLTKSVVSLIKDAGLKLIVWTVDDAMVAKRLADAGVDGITTNQPKQLREQLQGSR
jgi:glycerophosphoryl diester phosphodiesterase